MNMNMKLKKACKLSKTVKKIDERKYKVNKPTECYSFLTTLSFVAIL